MQSPALDAVFSLSMGWRQDDFDWSVAGNASGNDPNILSELEWSGVDSYQIRLGNQTQIGHYVYFRGYFNYGRIQDGTIRDSDYNGDNRTGEYSRSISECTGDQLWDLSFGIGYPIHLQNSGADLLIAPLFGKSIHKQNFRIKNGNQVLTWASGPSLGPLDGLNSTYEAKWEGPWIGFDLCYLLNTNSLVAVPMMFGLTFEYHFWNQYNAKANWNLRTDLEHPKSFEQEADAEGYIIEGKWGIQISDKWDLEFMADYQKWKTEDGVHRVYLAGGQETTTRLNEVHWTSHSFTIGLSYHFY